MTMSTWCWRLEERGGCYASERLIESAQDVTEFEVNPDGGYRETKLDQILLNGNNVTFLLPCDESLTVVAQICMLVPGGEGPVAQGGGQ